MATREETGYLTNIDKNGNKTILFPATKIECVDGLEEALASMGGTSGITIVHITIDGYKADMSFSEIVKAQDSGQAIFALIDLYGGYPFNYIGTISHDGVNCAKFQYMKYFDSTLTGKSLNGVDIYIDDEKNVIFDGFNLYPVGAPYTASVGQTIVVKAVNEKGFPIEWEAVDVGSGSGIYVNDEEPVDAPENAVWIDTSEDGESTFGGYVAQSEPPEDTTLLWIDIDDDTDNALPDGEEMAF